MVLSMNPILLAKLALSQGTAEKDNDCMATGVEIRGTRKIVHKHTRKHVNRGTTPKRRGSTPMMLRCIYILRKYIDMMEM